MTRSLEEFKDALSDNLSLDAVLDKIGLQQKRTGASLILPVVGIFAAGALVGGLLGLLFAPRSGRALRAQIKDKVGHVRGRVQEEMGDTDMTHA